MGRIRVGHRTVQTSNEGKVLFPNGGLTKGDLVAYYARIAEVMLPHVRDRIVSMHRFPDGIEEEGFFQKTRPDYFPDWVGRANVDLKEGGRQEQVAVADAATLVYLADQACITPHTWLSRIDRPDRPDRLVFDLDPPGEDFAAVRSAARRVRELLDELELAAGVQTTGSRGLHVVVPLDRTADFDATRRFAADAAELLARRHPDELTDRQRKSQRRGRLFVDYLRNAIGQTAVPPYAVRALPGAPVAAPLDWDELGIARMGPRRYTVRNIFRRLARKQDPWRLLDRRATELAAARGKLDKLLDEQG